MPKSTLSLSNVLKKLLIPENKPRNPIGFKPVQ